MFLKIKIQLMADMKDHCSVNNNVDVLPVRYEGLSRRESVSNVFLYDTIKYMCVALVMLRRPTDESLKCLYVRKIKRYGVKYG